MLFPVKLKKEGYQDYIEVVRLTSKPTKILQAKIKKIEGLLARHNYRPSAGAKVIINGGKKPSTRPSVISKLSAEHETRSHAKT